jgi:hypothetical protein
MEFASKSEHCFILLWMILILHLLTQETNLRRYSWEAQSCIAAYLAEKFSAFYGKRILNAVFASTQPQPLEYVWETWDFHSDADKESRCLDVRQCGFVNKYELFAYVSLTSPSWWSTEKSARSHIPPDWNLSMNWIICTFTCVCCLFHPV